MTIAEYNHSFIIDQLVFTKLSNGFGLHNFDGEFYVIACGYIFPYRIFLLGLLSYNLWGVKYSKQDWVRINKDLASLWKIFDIKEGVLFELIPFKSKSSFYKDTLKKRKEVNVKLPSTVLRNILVDVDVDPNIIQFFEQPGRSLETVKAEAFLYILDNQHKSLAK